MTQWEKNAHEAEEVYGCFVDWEEKFYTCPACGEPIYECDWPTDELESLLCPVCEMYHDED